MNCNSDTGKTSEQPSEILFPKTNLAHAVAKSIISRENLRQYLKKEFVS